MVSELDKMAALTEAGFTYPEVWHNYAKCVRFLKSFPTWHCTCPYVEEEIMELLKKIGELE